MGSLLPTLVGFNKILYNQLLGPSKMLAFLSLASLLTLSQAGVLPAGINAATCTNYPFCGPSQIAGPANVPANTAAYEAVKQIFVGQPVLKSQVWKLMLQLRMPSLLGWELLLGL